MDTIKRVGLALLWLAVVLIVSGTVRVLLAPKPQTPPIGNEHSVFVATCVQAGATEQYCGCALNKLLEMHPDLYTNQATVDRITAEGNDSAEMEKMRECL